MAKHTKVSISNLPLPPSSDTITHNLTPDPNTPDSTTFISQVLPTKPSIQRRARLLSPEAHFSYVSPMPLEFPYEVTPPDPPELVQDKAAYIEKWLSNREATISSSTLQDGIETNVLHKYISKARDQRRELIALSETCLRDCLPHLDVGDAFLELGRPALVPSGTEKAQSEETFSAEAQRIRQDLVDVLGGHAVLMSTSDPAVGEKGFAPWSARYSGHQFGVWAGQLGDGRAISILVTPHPSREDVTYELQLKGAGRTPFSRSADGLAVLRSSIREYLCSEAMHALSIPTTRSLSLVSLPELSVLRERVETACVCTRVAESFIRIGNFEALSPPTKSFFLGGGQQDADYEALRTLGEWTVRKVLRLKIVDIEAGNAWGKELVYEVARRNAKMVAAWQAYGFMHGVMNTDNISILGLTIDYGPYAFMDVFDSYHICNHTDQEGRYAYKFQPNMIVYACRALLNALAPLIGAEIFLGNKAVKEGWAANVSDDTLNSWRTAGIEQTKSTMERILEETCALEYNVLLRKRLALRRHEPTDQRVIFQPLLDMMEEQKLDFHGTFRKLSFFRPRILKEDSADAQGTLELFIKGLLSGSSEVDRIDHAKSTEQWLTWLHNYSIRVEAERTDGQWAEEEDFEAAREKAAKAANPRFVLRQWVLEEVIKKVEADHATGKRTLAKVMQMACSPFELWGAENDIRPDDELDIETREERRFCSLGDKNLLGFQCSCSS
ncbi:hypothetical protein F5I97DRAFT_2037881 [Phlebopus sp. FC_14]|nr:hypothetical protein F5I97DRAFT_2037881 [Phlebopus sp. FC_14]